MCKILFEIKTNNKVMKKIIFPLVIAVCALVGCKPETQKVVKSQDGTTISARSFEMNGHVYIEFRRAGSGLYDNYTGFVHDPECEKRDIKALIEDYMQKSKWTYYLLQLLVPRMWGMEFFY